MTFEEFNISLKQDNPPPSLNPILKALWYEGKGDWEASHQIVQDINSKDAAWVHAYLHRKEGDAANASYWYHRADRKHAEVSLEKEWEEITRQMLR